ncbi:MAG: autotransporter outer membrane beta-barrel domain-containing protein, partial [Alphaproteobacteria bacterium]|jgi:hypothetical protein|nr:autotransporter outer membrane beta-barrel domain-containing protein [Alphaproteobacteria bacterium]
VGGDIEQTQGTLIIDNIDWLNSLTIDSSEDSNLVLHNVNHLGNLFMKGGSLFLTVNHENNIHDDEYAKGAIHLDNAEFTGGVTTTMIRDTAQLRLGEENTFLLIDASGTISALSAKGIDQNLFSSSLTLGFDTEFDLSPDGKQLLLHIKRTQSLEDLVRDADNVSSDSNTNQRVDDLASHLDDLINVGSPLQILDYLQAYSSSPNELANNLNSLIPMSRDNYIKTAHVGLIKSLDVSKSNALAEDKNFWAVYYYANGRYNGDNEDRCDIHQANSIQLGYNIYKNINEKNQQKQAFGVLGGVSLGDMRNYDFNTDILSLNAGGMYRYQQYNHILNFTVIYSLSSFDTNRDYFISTNEVPSSLTFANLDRSRLQSSSNIHEVFGEAQYSYEYKIMDTGATLTPKLFIAPSVLYGNSYVERGPYSAVEVKSQTIPILESGGGIDLTQMFELNNGSLGFSIGSDMFYRHYEIPSKQIAFEGTPFGTTLGEKTAFDGLVVIPRVATNYYFKSSKLGVFYQRESSKNYFENTIGFSYRYNF